MFVQPLGALAPNSFEIYGELGLPTGPTFGLSAEKNSKKCQSRRTAQACLSASPAAATGGIRGNLPWIFESRHRKPQGNTTKASTPTGPKFLRQKLPVFRQALFNFFY